MSSWTERQGQVGDLTRQSKEELCELLLRQDHMLANKRFIQRLPDKGKKISEFAERVRLAIARHEEQEKKRDMLSFTEFQSKYQQAFSSQQQRGVAVVHNHHPAANHDGAGEEEEEEDAGDGQIMETVPVTAGGSLPLSDGTEESDLAEALNRVSLSHTTTAAPASTGRSSSTGSASAAGERKEDTAESTDVMNNYFLGKHPQKAHFMEVLAKNERNPVPRRQKFKPNQLGPRGVSPSGGSLSPGRSSPGAGGLLSPSPVLSPQARKERDMKHLDDITAARLPLLHYQPARLLSMEESAELLRDQTRKQQELQAKQAAQKLSEGLRSSSMGSFHPDGGPTSAYREEVHHHDDDGAQLSSEEED